MLSYTAARDVLVKELRANAADHEAERYDTIGRRFEGDPVLRQNLERSLRVMLGFYGLEIDVQRIVRAPSFAERARNWLTPHNHNFLRLTRMLKSLALLGAGDRATQLLDCLEDIYREQPGVVGSTTFGYWQTAV